MRDEKCPPIRRASLGVFWCGLAVACVTRVPVQEPPATSPSHSKPAKVPERPETNLGVPKLLPFLPDGNVLDLGPVLSPQKSSQRRDAAAVLLNAAVQLGADAFVFEKQPLREVYPIPEPHGSDWPPASQTVPPTIFTGPIQPGSTMAVSESETGYYRAVRFFEQPPKPCVLSRGLLGPSAFRRFTPGQALSEQLIFLNVLFSAGVIDSATFSAQRKHCINQLKWRADQRESSVAEPPPDAPPP